MVKTAAGCKATALLQHYCQPDASLDPTACDPQPLLHFCTELPPLGWAFCLVPRDPQQHASLCLVTATPSQGAWFLFGKLLMGSHPETKTVHVYLVHNWHVFIKFVRESLRMRALSQCFESLCFSASQCYSSVSSLILTRNTYCK